MKRTILTSILVWCMSLGVAYAATPTNLIANGTFETGATNAPANWVSYDWGTGSSVMTYPVTGLNGRGIQITVTAAGADFGRSLTPTAALSTTGGKQYTYSDNTKCTTRTMDLDVEYTYNDGHIEYVGLVPQSAVNNTWVTNTHTFTIPAGVVKFMVYRATATVGSCVIDNVFLSEPTVAAVPTDPLVSFTFDDGYLQGPAVNLLKKYNLKGTFYINSGPVQRGWSGYFTPGQVRTLALNGNEVGGHTVDHLSLPSLTDPQILAQVKNDKTALQTMSGTPVVSFAYPYGDGEDTARVRTQVKAAGMTNARGVQWGYNPRPTDTFGMQARCLESSETLAQAKAMVDTAIATKGWMQFCFHGITTSPTKYDWTPINLEALIQYVIASKAKVVTVTEGVNLRK
jgi:peptidoglycan/xylan/chitin deacetylase (PgdA/CDA1 family)